MENYIESKFLRIKNNYLEKEKLQNIIESSKVNFKDNLKNFVFMINEKTSKDLIDETLEKLDSVVVSKNLRDEEKKKIFFFVLIYEKILEVNKYQLRDENNNLIKSIELVSPNHYFGILNEREIYFSVIIKNEIVVYENYKLMELFQIPLPFVKLNFKIGNYKTIVNEKYYSITDFSCYELENDILTILREFNKNSFFVKFSRENIVQVKRQHFSYYLVNLTEISKEKIDFLSQLKLFYQVINKKKNITNYNNTIEIYDKLIKY